jgi:hypothetical protein
MKGSKRLKINSRRFGLEDRATIMRYFKYDIVLDSPQAHEEYIG